MRIIITENQLKKLIIKESDENNDVGTEEQLQKAKNLVKKLQSKGFSYTGAVGLVGNIAHETGGAFDPSINQVGGPAKGLMQWERPRFTALEKFSDHLGKSWGDLNTQVEFMKFELLDKYLYNGELLPDFKKPPLNSVALYKQRDGSYKGVMGYETKQYQKSVVDGDIETTTKNLMTNVFRPDEGNIQMRVNNSKKIDEYIKGGGIKQKDKSLSDKDFTIYPNPVSPNSEVTIKVKENKLPIETVEMKIYTTAGKFIKKHNWVKISKGILQFNAPDSEGIYLLRINNQFNLKLFVK